MSNTAKFMDATPFPTMDDLDLAEYALRVWAESTASFEAADHIKAHLATLASAQSVREQAQANQAEIGRLKAKIAEYERQLR